MSNIRPIPPCDWRYERAVVDLYEANTPKPLSAEAIELAEPVEVFSADDLMGLGEQQLRDLLKGREPK